VNSSKVYVECAVEAENPEATPASLQALFDEQLAISESEFARTVLNRYICDVASVYDGNIP
jgi:hypothetical protein